MLHALQVELQNEMLWRMVAWAQLREVEFVILTHLMDAAFRCLKF